ncbi:hypothetical protein BX616_004358 [Lobosporangium transversale]|uniref:Mannosyltransferase putative-domain-containing protein n=1 Tax=Lobosporangium transversale TaxID=64571 RepID=A0A1Y2G634_9FUNG|nr:mannosyltransferase putative-domain-containing protein [Lobosporangium transversale]KAF9898195.1 hypothetical protein BX616_004358 [Lobosporangium transversale]ORY97032.1 mannosyltransferase putative-domain-containing protein [Lobosporangium transversale]|eukprot:XP_021875578.1 mannosyltransferase putative-domain-containing protein [Lobosporangium transversale]
MQIGSAIPSSLRRAQALRIIAILAVFFVLASVSRYHGSFDFSIDEDGQVQSVPHEGAEHDIYYTHHIATFDPKDIKPWTKGDTAALRTPEGQRVVQYLTESPFQPPSAENENKNWILKDNHFLTLTKRLRVFRALWHAMKAYYDQLSQEGQQDQFYNAPPSEIAPAIEFLQKLEQATFPWVLSRHKTTFDLFQTYKDGGRGIVMCVGNYHAKFARTAIKVLREVVNSTLPVEIYYTGHYDLTPENRAWFEKYENVRTIDITTVIDNELIRLGGWAIKPFALLISKFSEVILMDSDAYFLEPPEVLFEDGGYKEVGTVFFYDRTLFPGAGGDKKVWMESFLPSMSNHPSKTRWFNRQGDHEMESGVVVLDKTRHFLGLLAICKINDLHERDQVTYRKTWGDKESFWIALEMIQERYSFIRYRGGVIGNVGDAIPYKKVLPQEEIDRYLQGESLTVTNPIDPQTNQQTRRDGVNMDRVCGNQLHFNYRGQPLWWNSGVVRDKFTSKSPYLKYTAYMKDEDGAWDFGDSCIVQKNPGAIMEVEWSQRQIAFKVIQADREVALEYNQPDFKEILEIPKLIKSEGAKGGNGNSEAV